MKYSKEMTNAVIANIRKNIADINEAIKALEEDITKNKMELIKLNNLLDEQNDSLENFMQD